MFNDKYMKKYFVIIATAFCIVSCEDYLDAVPEVEGATEEIVFNNFYSVRGFFDNVFNILDDYLVHNNQGMGTAFMTSELAGETVNIRSPYQVGMTFLMRGQWDQRDVAAETGWNGSSPFGSGSNVIPKSFYGIQVCNTILEVVDGMKLTDDEKNQLLGQAYFFRAWFYFEVIRRVGGFVLMDKKFYASDDGNMIRMTYAESTDKMINESLNKAIEILPDKWEDLTQTGRPTKSSAYALRSMAQLYSASPLMRNGIEEIVQYDDYDEERVKLAAEYAKDCLEYLERNAAIYDQRMMTLEKPEDYASIFYYPRSQFMSREMLWYINNLGSRRANNIQGYWQTWRMMGLTNMEASGNVNPTLSTINKFETINGYPCVLSSTGWDCEDPNWNEEKPFAARDPRLYNNIILPGERFGNLAAAQITNNEIPAGFDVPAAEQNAFYLCTWDSDVTANIGREIDSDNNNIGAGGEASVVSRFLIKKYMAPSCVQGTSNASNFDANTFSTSFIRATQVWLDYAEAMNEAYGPNDRAGYQWSAVEAVNKVRDRVGMPPVLSKFTGDKKTFRERIRNERAVELFCEQNLWFDIRRWMIAEELFKEERPMYRARVTFKSDAVSAKAKTFPPGKTEAERLDAKYGGCFNYEKENINTHIRIFDRKHYWYPMRKDEVDRYPDFKQNPYW